MEVTPSLNLIPYIVCEILFTEQEHNKKMRTENSSLERSEE